jgi:hypothetical protein
MAFAPIISLAFTAVSTVMGVVGAIQQGQAQSDMAKYQAQVARNNATIAQQNAEYAVAAGESKAQSQDFKNRAIAGQIEAAQSASGIDLASPSLQDVRASSAQVGRLDTANVMADAMLVARGQESKAFNYTSEAGLQDAAASYAKQAGYTKAFGALVSGGSSFAEKWDKYSPPDTGSTVGSTATGSFSEGMWGGMGPLA